ncbi:hypothetical protein BKA81DRAFT_350880 [Phyllosticta paracitricarpa]
MIFPKRRRDRNRQRPGEKVFSDRSRSLETPLAALIDAQEQNPAALQVLLSEVQTCGGFR